MVAQYPHTCTYGTPGTEDVFDPELGWIPGEPGSLVAVECRAVPAGKGRKVRGQDGTMIEYSYDIAFPIEVEDIPKWQLVTITDQNDGVIVEGNLLSFNAGQLHKLASI